jgi:alkanesulfonate monooxygenase SsuD/methylene tetrahydromethanopterin reductase-like flavin-dependent oxidoreductase (luciferase family)
MAASATYNEPYNLVTTNSTITREFVALELVSHGRAGWNVVTAPSEAKNFGRDA